MGVKGNGKKPVEFPLIGHLVSANAFRYSDLAFGGSFLLGIRAMRLSGGVIGLLKEYMHDMVEQAKQEEAAIQSFGYASQPYRADQAISDLLAILDDRIESEGVQMGLPVEFLHQMWMLCNEAGGQIGETVWLKKNLENSPPSKARTRELTYHALIEYLESQPE